MYFLPNKNVNIKKNVKKKNNNKIKMLHKNIKVRLERIESVVRKIGVSWHNGDLLKHLQTIVLLLELKTEVSKYVYDTS